MRKLKLQTQITIDGFCAGPNGELDWMTWDWDDKLKDHVNAITRPVDTILLGRKMADGFINYWTNAMSDSNNPDYPFAKMMIDPLKVVFSNTLKKSNWDNTIIAGGNLTEEINKLKDQKGGDIIAYGGSTFVSNLIQTGLIDEIHLFVNPVAIGSGLYIFKNRTNLKLLSVAPFECGVVDLVYS